MPDVTARLLRQLTLLQSGRRWSGAELAERLGVSVRSVRRDMDRLRGYGYRIEAQPGPAGFYRLASGDHLPPLVLDDDEAVAILSALTTMAATGQDPGSLGEAAGRARLRLEQILPRRLRHRSALLRRATHASPVNAPTTPTRTMSALARAIDDHRVVSFDYQRHEVCRRRTVEPQHLVNRHLAWYLVGWDRGRGDWRTFRLDRIHGLDTSTAAFVPRDLPAESVDSYLDRGFLRDRERVTVTVEGTRDDVAGAFAYQDVRLEAVSPTTTRVVLHLDDWRWLLVALASLDTDFTIDGPDGIAGSVGTFATRLAGAVEPRPTPGVHPAVTDMGSQRETAASRRS